jgi:hypothetical protein
MLEKVDERVTEGIRHPRGNGPRRCDIGRYDTRHSEGTGIAIGKSLSSVIGTGGQQIWDFRVKFDFTT